MLLRRLIPYCERYWASDVSAQAIDQLQQRLASNADLQMHGEACASLALATLTLTLALTPNPTQARL